MTMCHPVATRHVGTYVLHADESTEKKSLPSSSYWVAEREPSFVLAFARSHPVREPNHIRCHVQPFWCPRCGELSQISEHSPPPPPKSSEHPYELPLLLTSTGSPNSKTLLFSCRQENVQKLVGVAEEIANGGELTKDFGGVKGWLFATADAWGEGGEGKEQKKNFAAVKLLLRPHPSLDTKGHLVEKMFNVRD